MRVFISSTYIDLVEHRDAVVDVLLRMNLEPVGMEHFGSRGEEPSRACPNEIDRCDVFVGIYGWRYGYQPQPDGPSITEQEFQHATRRKEQLLILCYLIDPAEPFKPTGESETAVRQLAAFKERVKRQFVRDTFTTPDVLATRVSTALSSEIERRAAVAAGDLRAVNWSQYPDEVRTSVLTLLSRGETDHQQTVLRRAVATLVKEFARDPSGAATRAEVARAPIVARHEFFGSLLYDRSFGDYLPFDRAATEIFLRARERPVEELVAALGSEEQRRTLEQFVGLCRQVGIFNDAGIFNGVFLDEQRAAVGRLSAPTRVILQCTTACPYACEHCLFSAGRPVAGELTTREIGMLLDELAESGCFMLDLDGGEPLVRADLPVILEDAQNCGIAVRLATNAAAATRETIAELKRVRIQSINVRLEGAGAQVCDAIRGETGAFDAAVEGIQRLKGLGVPIELHCVVTRKNGHEIEALAELVAEFGLSRLAIHVAPPVGRAAEHPDLLLTPTEVDELRARHSAISQRIGVEISMSGSPRQRLFPQRCDCGTVVCHVDARGGVTPSGFVPAVAGDTIRERTLGETWSGSPAFAAARAASVPTSCPSCSYFSG